MTDLPMRDTMINELADSSFNSALLEAPHAVQVPQWVIVSQVKSHRVVYFTDDPSYQPPMDADWYYCSPYSGGLPTGMTLRNCWGWRFNGAVFTDAREPEKKSAEDSLLESNRKALLKLLGEKINAIREPFLPSCQGGDAVRQSKLREAKAYQLLQASPAPDNLPLNTGAQAGAGVDDAYSLLHAVATARNISLLQAADLIIAKAQETQRVMLETERFRESLTQAIQISSTQAQLNQTRSWLLDQIYPALSREFKFHVDQIEPIALDKPLGQTHRVHEIARLKAQLREAINAQRAALRSDYIQNDEIRKHKAQLARAVLHNGGTAPQGIDATVLQDYAQARQLSLGDAAQAIVNSMAAAAEVLARTEAHKDRMLARIDALKSMADVRDISAEIKQLVDAA